MRKVTEYIVAHDLRCPSDKRIVVPDAPLLALLRQDAQQPPLAYFNIAERLRHHLTPDVECVPRGVARISTSEASDASEVVIAIRREFVRVPAGTDFEIRCDAAGEMQISFGISFG